MIEVRPPYERFVNLDGKPVDGGYIYIGNRGQDPETSPQQAYWDAELTVPVALPIRTVNGYASNGGSPAQLYTQQRYSIRVRDEDLNVVYEALTVNAVERNDVTVGSGNQIELSRDQDFLEVAAKPTDAGTQIIPYSGATIVRGLTDRTTNALELRPGQAVHLRKIGRSGRYSGNFDAIDIDTTGVTGNGQGAAWSPDGRYLATSHQTSPLITIYDWSSGVPVKIADPATLPTGTGYGAAWSPDGRYLAVGHDTPPYITIYDWSSGVPVKIADPATLPTGTGYSPAWSPDGRYLAIAHDDFPRITIYDWSSGAPVKIADPATLPTAIGYGAAWSPDGRYLAVGHSESPYITIYDWSSGVPVKIADPSTLPTTVPTATCYGTAWSPDGRYLTVGIDTPPNITIYDWESGVPVKIADPATLPTLSGRSTSWSPDSRYLAVAHFNSPYVTIYDWLSGAPVKIADPATLPTGTGFGAAWSPDGRYLSVAHDTSPFITIYDTFSGIAEPWEVTLLDGPPIKSSAFLTRPPLPSTTKPASVLYYPLLTDMGVAILSEEGKVILVPIKETT